MMTKNFPLYLLFVGVLVFIDVGTRKGCVMADMDTFSLIGHLIQRLPLEVQTDENLAKATFDALKMACLLVKETNETTLGAECRFRVGLDRRLAHKLIILRKFGMWKRNELLKNLDKNLLDLKGITHALKIVLNDENLSGKNFVPTLKKHHHTDEDSRRAQDRGLSFGDEN